MNLYRRSFSVLKARWKQLLTASVSAALHALFAAALVWMVGPLLMTLFDDGTTVGLVRLCARKASLRIGRALSSNGC